MCNSDKSNIYIEDLLIIMAVMTNQMCFSSLTRYALYNFTTHSPRRTHVKTSMLCGVCQALCRLEAASYVNQSRKGCMGTNIPPSGFSQTSVVVSLIWLVCPCIWWAYKLCAGCLGVPWSSHCCLAGVFPGCNLDQRGTLLRICGKLWTLSLGGCPSTVSVVPPFLGKCSRILAIHPVHIPSSILSQSCHWQKKGSH